MLTDPADIQQVHPLTVEVAIPLPIDQTFSYTVPDNLTARALPGTRALISFRNRIITGFVLGPGTACFDGTRKPLLDILDTEPLFSHQDITFYRWISGYYLCPLGEVIKTAIPAGLIVKGRQTTPSCPVTPDTMRKSTRCRMEKHYSATGSSFPASLKGKALEILRHVTLHPGQSASALRAVFPHSGPQVKRLEMLGLIIASEQEVYRSPFDAGQAGSDPPKVLNEEQSAALGEIEKGIHSGQFTPFLLHGVTGSGKTEVYLQAIATVLAAGREAMVLVPEIALTPQLLDRFRKRFSCGIAVMHSRLSNGERYDEWRRISRGEARIVIGARSAIFAPIGNPGIIVVDEEHEATYKQSDGLRYNARDLALVLAKQHSAVAVLGSATPLVTSVHAARSGRLRELSLQARVYGRPMPETVLVDQRGCKGAHLSQQLTDALRDNLAAKGQSILFLNRRGFAPWLVCRDCGFTLRCPNCSVTLTYHQQKKRHVCHYCDHSIPAPSVCPNCDGGEIGLFGMGTERLEEEIIALFPGARVARMDRDSTSGRGGHSRILKKLECGEIDILIGTQMIAKGHDFPDVTLVGVINADTALNIPDFRGSERGFQLVSQVSGRAGRGDNPGKVFVQTLNPDHFALAAALDHDYEAFYRQEIADRKDAGYPPFSHIAAIQLSSTSLKLVEHEAAAAANALRALREKLGNRIEILGPVASPLSMIRGRHRWQILLKSARRDQLHTLLRRFRSMHQFPNTLRMAIDIDPLELL